MPNTEEDNCKIKREMLKKAKRIVIKLGTNTVTDEEGRFNYGVMESLAKQIHSLKKEGKQLVIVSSGAIRLGNGHMKWKKTDELVLNQCSASIGQNILMNSYSGCFQHYDVPISQILLTYDDLKDAERNKKVKKLIEKLLELGVIAIINENDSVSTEEITFGDNDMLSAYVSNIIKADLLIILSHVNGLYKNIEKEEVVDFVEDINPEVEMCVTGGKSDTGKGGMSSKLAAAKIASSSGTLTVVANGNEKDIIKRILKGEDIGTLFYLNRRKEAQE